MSIFYMPLNFVAQSCTEISNILSSVLVKPLRKGSSSINNVQYFVRKSYIVLLIVFSSDILSHADHGLFHAKNKPILGILESGVFI